MPSCFPSECWPAMFKIFRRRLDDADTKFSAEGGTKTVDLEEDSDSDASEILPFLYLGNLASRNSVFLTEKKIAYIVNGVTSFPMDNINRR